MSAVSRAAPEFTGTARFEVIRQLGSGGMGTVYEAHDRTRDSRVALKRLHATSAEALLHLKAEFRALEDLRHPNLVSLFELVEEAGHWFFTMELVRGVDFLAHVRSGALEVTPSGFSVTGVARRAAEMDPPCADVATPTPPTGEARGTLDEARLRDALGQLARGLAALHEAGKVHRDVKPSNILVTAGGRLVLLDFGLSTGLVGGQTSGEDRAVGTRAFMAPEQAAGGRITSAADCYSAGVLLHLALTGEVPFRGTEVDRQRANRDAPPVRTRNPDAPADLAALCDALLALDPASRPSAGDLLKRLGARENARTAVRGAPFVGRTHELELLYADFRESRRRATTSLIVGDSGLGKSALAKEMLRAITQETPDVLVFRSRCYERELVPFKAFDGIVDGLSHFLRALSPEVVHAYAGGGAELLARVFPVLRRVPLFAETPTVPTETPLQQRGRAFESLRALLGAIARERPLVLFIDDLQWADADSMDLLGDLLEAGAAPALHLVATARRRSGEDPLAAVEARIGRVRRVALSPLPADDSTRLVRAALGESAAGDADGRGDAETASILAREGGGHPLFLLALAHHARQDAGVAGGAPALRDGGAMVKLEEAIMSRVLAVDVAAQRLLDLVMVAGAPLSASAASHAARMDHAAYTASADALRLAHLVRPAGAGDDELIEPYHDRVRETVLGTLVEERRRLCHQKLADALEATGRARQDPQSLVRHLVGAGEPERAARQAERAAAHALRGLAFDQAAELYRTAILHGSDAAWLQTQRVALAETLTAGGRGHEAADAYLASVPGAETNERLEYQRRAADHLLRSGHLERGTHVVSGVLAELGDSLPKTQLGALAGMVLLRARAKIRGLDWDPRHESRVPADTLRRIDVYHAVSVSLCLIDTARGSFFQERSLALALEAGEPLRLARCLAMQACYTGSTSGSETATRYFEQVRRIFVMTGDPYLGATLDLVGGFIDYHSGAFRAAEARFKIGEQKFREGLRGAYFESGFCHWFRLVALRNMGLLGELQRGFAEWTRDAERRGDRFSEASIRLNLSSVWLARDDPEEALRDLERVRWIPPEGGFHLQHWYAESARCDVDLYTGDAAAGLARFVPYVKKLSRSYIFQMRFHRLHAWWILARLYLAAADVAPDPRAALTEAARSMRSMENEDVGFGRVWGALVRAAIEHRRGRTGEAIDVLEGCAREADAVGLEKCSEAARYRIAQLRGGTEGRALMKAAQRWFAAQQIVVPERMVQAWAPGFGAL